METAATTFSRKRAGGLLLLPLLICAMVAGMRLLAPSRSERALSPSEKPARLLVRAVERGDIRAVAEMLREGANPDTRRPLHLTSGGRKDSRQRYVGTPLLEIAVRRGDPAMARILLERGADVNIRGRFGFTPLMAAALEGEPALVRLLLEAGADPNMQDTARRDTALHLAACHGNPSLSGRRPGSAEEGKRDILGYRPPRGELEVVAELLLEAGARRDARNKWGGTPEDAALGAGFPATAQFIRRWHPPARRLTAGGSAPADGTPSASGRSRRGEPGSDKPPH